ncbi:MAG: hypothetical protein ACD_75C00707G0001 [uncultured bacterium]|nr:MAG: hypothetical protein ACD_75C00707G0001 [uncultured bacterium]
MEPVDSLGGNFHGGMETEGYVGHRHVVVNGLGQGEDIEASLGQAVGVFLGPTAADADQGIEIVAPVVVTDRLGHIHDLAADRHLMGLIAAGAENRPPAGQNRGQGFTLEPHGSILQEAAKTVAKAQNVHAGRQSRLADGANRRIQARTIPAGSQYPNMFTHYSLCRISFN